MIIQIPGTIWNHTRACHPFEVYKYSYALPTTVETDTNPWSAVAENMVDPSTDWYLQCIYGRILCWVWRCLEYVEVMIFDIFCDVSKIRQTVWIHPIHPSINASEYAVCRRIAGHLLDGLGPESTHGWIAPHNRTLSLKTRTTSLWWRQHLHLASPAHWDMDCMDWCLSSFSLWLKWLKCIPANQWNPVIPIDHAAGSLDINGQDWSWQDLQRHRYRGLLWLARPGTETNWEMPLLSYWCYCTCRAQVVYLSMSEDGAGHPSSVPMCFGVKSMRLWWIQESEIPWCIADRSFLRPISSISCMSIVWVCFQWIQFLWISPGLSTSNGVCRWSHIQIGIWPWFIAPMCGWAGRPRPEVNYVEKGLSSGNVLGLLTMAVACRK